MTTDIDEIVRRLRNGNYSELILKEAADALERLKAEIGRLRAARARSAPKIDRKGF